MKLSVIFLFLLATVVHCGKHPNMIGEFHSEADDATCKMLKLDMGDNNHAVVMECTCAQPGVAGNKKTYSCSYFFKGNFDACSDESKVYKETEMGFAEQSTDQAGGCSAVDIQISSEVCPEEVYLVRHHSLPRSPCLSRDEL